MPATLLSVRGWLMIGMAMGIMAIQFAYPTEATSVWPPVAAALAAVLLYRRDIRQYDWTVWKRAKTWEHVFLAVTQGMIAQAIGIVIVQYGLRVPPPSIPVSATPAIIFVAIVVSAVLEELIYRKIVFGAINRFLGFWTAATASSMLFALAHANYSAYLGYVLMGLVWCRTYRKTGDIGILIAAHLFFNAIAMTVIAARG